MLEAVWAFVIANLEKIMGLFTAIERYRKMRRENKEVEAKEQEQAFMQKQVEEIWPYVILWVSNLRQGLRGQRELKLSHLRDFFTKHFEGDFMKVSDGALEECWKKLRGLDGVAYDEETNSYIVRNW